MSRYTVILYEDEQTEMCQAVLKVYTDEIMLSKKQKLTKHFKIAINELALHLNCTYMILKKKIKKP